MGGRTVRGARPGEAVILYGTGFGATNPPTLVGRILASGAPIASSATIRVGSDAAIADHTGRSGFVGVFQFNIHTPDLPDGEYEISAELGGVRT